MDNATADFAFKRNGTRYFYKPCPACGEIRPMQRHQVNCSRSCGQRWRERPDMRRYGPDHPSWRDDVGYYGMHIRVRKQRGKADHCSACGRSDDDVCYDWASLVDKPESPDDFAPMCRPCHRKYDVARDHERPGWQGAAGSKLTADIVRKARAEHAMGVTFTDLASRYGVTQVCMSKAVRGLTWGWLK